MKVMRRSMAERMHMRRSGRVNSRRRAIRRGRRRRVKRRMRLKRLNMFFRKWYRDLVLGRLK